MFFDALRVLRALSVARSNLSILALSTGTLFAGTCGLAARPANSDAADVPVAEALRTRDQVQQNFLNFADGLASRPVAALADVQVHLTTVGPGPTPTTAFGHSALRVLAGEEFGAADYYVDFGQYDETPGFLWRFLRGRARFFVHVGETGGALNSWDAAARGMLTTELKLANRQKQRIVAALAEQVRTQADGYEYDNFYKNCVTYIRDVIADTAGVPLALDAFDSRRVPPEIFEGAQDTWRGRTYAWSNENVWLYIHENLLFDPDTDRQRSGEELIFMPDDLLLALDQAGLAGRTRVLVPHRHAHNPQVYFRFARSLDPALMQQFFPPGLNQFADTTYNSKIFFSGLALVILLLMLPVARFDAYRVWAERAFVLVYGFAGLYTTIIRFGTLFHFMDGTLIPLIFFPLDLLLLRRVKNAAERQKQFYYGLFRLGTIAVGILLAAFVWPQSILDLAFFALAFFALYTYHRRPGSVAAATTQTEGNA